MKKIFQLSIVVAICALSPYSGFSQSVTDTATIDKLYAKSKTFWYTSHDSSVFYLKQVDSLSRQINYTRGIGYASYGLGWNEKGFYKRFQYLTNALEWFEKGNDIKGRSLALTFIGEIYYGLGEYEKFREYISKSLEIKKQLNDYGGIALCYINLGNDFQRRKLYTEAIQNYNEALTNRLKEGREQGIAYALINLADVSLETGNVHESLNFAKKAKINFLSAKDAGGIMWSDLIIGSSYLKLNKLDSAQTALEAVVNNPYGIRVTYRVNYAQKKLIEVYERKRDLQKAFALQSQYIVIRDSLESLNQGFETQRLANEYEFKVAEKEALQQQEKETAKLARRNTIEYLTITVIVAMFFIILFSGRKWLKGNVVKAFIFIALLLLFESLLVITDPTVESWTQGEPIFKLLANVALALLILPFHRLLENFTKRRLIKT